MDPKFLRRDAFTLMDFIMIVAVLAIFAFVLLPLIAKSRA